MRISIASLAVLCLASAFAVAGDYGNDPADASTKHQKEAVGFDVLDVDGDGKLTKREASEHDVISTSFSKADSDGDGSLTREEYEQAGFEASS